MSEQYFEIRFHIYNHEPYPSYSNMDKSIHIHFSKETEASQLEKAKEQYRILKDYTKKENLSNNYEWVLETYGVSGFIDSVYKIVKIIKIEEEIEI